MPRTKVDRCRRGGHLATWGVRDTARSLPLAPQTTMYGASLTKTTVAYLVLMLVDERRLDLDATVAQLVPRPLPEYEEFAELASWSSVRPPCRGTGSTTLD